MGRRVARRDHAQARPRRRAHPHRARVQGLGGRRRVQRGARTQALLRHADDGGDCVRRQSGRAAGGGLHAPGRGGRLARRLDAVRRHRPDRPQRTQLRRARLRLPRRAELRRPRADGGQPAQAGHGRLGGAFRQGGREVVPHRRHLRRALRVDRRGGDRGAQGREGSRHGDELRPQLSRVAVEVDRRQGAGAGGTERSRSTWT